MLGEKRISVGEVKQPLATVVDAKHIQARAATFQRGGFFVQFVNRRRQRASTCLVFACFQLFAQSADFGLRRAHAGNAVITSQRRAMRSGQCVRRCRDARIHLQFQRLREAFAVHSQANLILPRSGLRPGWPGRRVSINRLHPI